MLNVNPYFSTFIGQSINPNHKQIEEKMVNRCYELQKIVEKGGKGWISDETYNTDKTYSVDKDNIFSEVTDYIQKNVYDYMTQTGLDERWIKKEPYDAWFNIYKQHNFQEFHNHSGCVISTIYFVKCDNTSAKVIFKNPYSDMMNVPSSLNIVPDDKKRMIELSGHTINFQPIPGMLLIFRSHLEHCVEQQKSNTERISLAYNFIKINR
jgi:uncharacterized protein (TIGR02466 family)